MSEDQIARSRAEAERLRKQLQTGRGGVLTRITLVRVLIEAGEPQQALEAARETSALAPGIGDAALALGEALLAAGHLPTAIAEFERALRLDDNSAAARYALGCAWLEAGEAERAVEFLEPLAQAQSEFTARAKEKLADAEALRAAARSAPGYVRHLFDQFSGDYDRKMLAELSYRAPLVLRGLADMLMPAQPHSLDILDLGCGTGLSGEAFAELARRLDGVDLSPRMIEKARARDIYHSLLVSDLETALAAPGPAYDLILAADTLVYLGDLRTVFAGVAARLQKFGFFLFTVEKHTGDDFVRGPKRRYVHAESYLRREAERAGLEIMGILDCSPRNEANQPVEGLAVALQRP